MACAANAARDCLAASACTDQIKGPTVSMRVAATHERRKRIVCILAPK